MKNCPPAPKIYLPNHVGLGLEEPGWQSFSAVFPFDIDIHGTSAGFISVTKLSSPREV